MRIDGRDSKEFAPRTTASKTAQRLRWCGHDSFLIANGFMLRAPMVYSSHEAPVDDEPSCINLSLDAEPPGRIAEPGPGTYPTYAGLSPAHRARYLLWLSKDRASSLEHIGFAFLYLCGLERRLFLERADLHEIVKETVRLRAYIAPLACSACAQSTSGVRARRPCVRQGRLSAHEARVREPSPKQHKGRSGRRPGVVLRAPDPPAGIMGSGRRAHRPALRGSRVYRLGKRPVDVAVQDPVPGEIRRRHAGRTFLHRSPGPVSSHQRISA